MASESGCSLGSFNRVKMDGSNIGAAMFVRGGHPPGCCCINIYVNSNVQGSSGSLVMGSKIKMQDPGVHLYFGDLRWGKTNRSRRGGEELGFYVVLLVLALLLLVNLLLKL